MILLVQLKIIVMLGDILIQNGGEKMSYFGFEHLFRLWIETMISNQTSLST